jgi:hypothetical protein
MHTQMCPEFAWWVQRYKDRKLGTTPTAPAQDGTEGEMEAELNEGTAARLSSSQGVSFVPYNHLFHVVDIACKMLITQCNILTFLALR